MLDVAGLPCDWYRLCAYVRMESRPRDDIKVFAELGGGLRIGAFAWVTDMSGICGTKSASCVDRMGADKLVGSNSGLIMKSFTPGSPNGAAETDESCAKDNCSVWYRHRLMGICSLAV